MTPEEIQRQAAARNSTGMLGEARQRALPAPTPRAPGTSIATAPQPRPSAPTAGNALATTAQPTAAPITGTARPVNRPQPAITVDPQGNAATLEQRTTQATQQRLASERAARAAAMNTGGIGALDDVVRQQQGPAGQPRASIGVAPAAAPTPQPAAPAGTSPRPGIVGRVARSAGPAAAVGLEGLRVYGAGQQGGITAAADESVNAAGRLGAAGVGSAAGAKLGSFLGPKGAAVGGLIGGIGGYALGDAGIQSMQEGAERKRALAASGALDPIQNADPRARRRTGLETGILGGIGYDPRTDGPNFVGLNPTPAQLAFRGVLRPEAEGAQPPAAAQRAAAKQQSATPNEAPASPPPDIDSVPIAESRTAEQGQVLGEINGRQVRTQPAAQPDALGTSGLIANPNNLYRRPEDNGQGQLNAQQALARSDRMSVQRGAKERLQGLYKKFNEQIGQGRRRTAAVIGEQIRAELGVLGQTASGQMIDPRRPDTSAARMQAEAEVGRLGEVTQGQRLENQNRQRLAGLEQIIADPDVTDERRAAAATQYQLLTGRGGQQQAEGRIVQLPGEDGFTQVPALLPPGSTQAIPITAAGQQQKQMVGQARGPDGKTYNVFADGSTELAQ